MKILLTGIAGFIGSNLGRGLAARGVEVVGLDSFDDFYEPAVKRLNIADLAGRVEVVEGDVLDQALVDDLLARGRFDLVLHLAALPGVRPSIERPARYQRVNVEGTAVIADAVARHGVKHLIYASSSSVYGYNQQRPYRETDDVSSPASPYGASKRSAELLLYSLHRIHGFGVTCLRYFTVYGPYQRPGMAIYKFCRAVRRGERITMFGAGDTSRDYTFIDDIVGGTIGAVETAGMDYRIYNLGNSHPITLRQLIAKIGEVLGAQPAIEQLAEQPGDVRHTLACIEAAERDLGYRPQISLDEGLRRYADWLQRRSQLLSEP